ncbi:MAG: FAD:protein FMN transferase [Pseudomonadota bacterium]
MNPTTAPLDLGFEFRAMASPCEVRIAGLPAPQAQDLAQQAIQEVQRIEAKYSRYQADSVVSRLNASAGQGQALPVDEETAHLLGFAEQLFQLSEGLFDITSGILRRAWNFQSGQPPTPDRLAALLPLVGWRQVRWSGTHLELPQAGMELDFGGFGKEYAADRAATWLQAQGVRHGLVNLGGDIRVMGPRLDGSAWQLGIQHPRHTGQILANLPLTEGALATSGDYERYLVHEGVRHCHILNPRTGWPVRHWQSVSVTAPACLAAGALSTLAMLQGPGALAFLQAQGVGGLLVDSEGRCHTVSAAL